MKSMSVSGTKSVALLSAVWFHWFLAAFVAARIQRTPATSKRVCLFYSYSCFCAVLIYPILSVSINCLIWNVKAWPISQTTLTPPLHLVPLLAPLLKRRRPLICLEVQIWSRPRRSL